MATNTFLHALATFLPFQDAVACEAARNISRADFTRHPNPNFHIRVSDSRDQQAKAFADTIIGAIQSANQEDRDVVLILPAGPMSQYRHAARRINRERISLKRLTTFNMDEYADEHGKTAPPTWPGSFQYAMYHQFFDLIDKDLRPSPGNIRFPSSGNIDRYSEMIQDAGEADVCFGGVGWSGHIAFWEPQLGVEFGDDLDAFKAAPARGVELHPMTIMQNALHSFSGDWSAVPPRAATIGPRDIMNARHRSFWLEGSYGPDGAYQRFIARLAAHGPVTPLVPASLLQTVPSDYTVLSEIADDVVASIT
jgi:glucosamine-6-phosphate deaminase